MKAVKVKEGIYWVGAIDWNVRNFHGYQTQHGTTYGAYLILDEKVTLIDTVKADFADEMLARISDVIDPAKIDIIVSNHVEMDHSGALPAVRLACPNAAVYTSTPAGVKGLTAHYGAGSLGKGYEPAPDGSGLSLGKRSLTFISTPMLHWPDNMVAYCPEEKILFSNDAFGQHSASTERFDDELELTAVLDAAKGYYGNILMCYGRQARKAWEAVQRLNIDMIAPSHGVIWRSHVTDILEAYGRWSENAPKTGAIVVYDSMWHSTEKMAVTITEAFAASGVPAKLHDLKADHYSAIIPEVLTSKYIAVGSPTLNNQMMPSVAGFLCYLRGLSPGGREAFAFGSYGWGGQSVPLIERELEACGFHLCIEGVKINYVPHEAQREEIFQKVTEMAARAAEKE